MIPRRRLGTSDLEVSVVGLGGNTFGPPRLDEAETARVISAALDHGVNFVDTALLYGQGQSEEFIGKALGSRRDEMIIATKYHFFDLGDEAPADRVTGHVEESLRKLNTDRIDLLQVHFPNPDVPAADLMAALAALVGEGKVRALGACNYAGWRLAEAEFVAKELGVPGFATTQNYYNLLARSVEAEVAPFCREYRLSILPYHPLAGGFLTGKYKRGEPAPEGSRGAAGSPIIGAVSTAANYDRIESLESFARDHSRGINELAIAWLLSNKLVGSVIAGVSNTEQLAQNAAASSWDLGDDDLTSIEEIVGGTSHLDPERPPYL